MKNTISLLKRSLVTNILLSYFKYFLLFSNYRVKYFYVGKTGDGP